MIVFFDEECREALRRWLSLRARRAGSENALFIGGKRTRLQHDGVRLVVRNAAERVGLHTPGAPLEKRFGPHCCRHWFTTHLLRAGMRREHVAWLRGDHDGAAIMTYYHIDPEDVRRSYLACIPRLGI